MPKREGHKIQLDWDLPNFSCLSLRTLKTRGKAAPLLSSQTLLPSASTWLVPAGGVQGTACATVPTALGERG